MHLRRRETCGKCGTRRSEWDPDKGGDRHAYTAARGHCPGCASVEALRKEIDQSTNQIPGTYVSLLRSPRR